METSRIENVIKSKEFCGDIVITDPSYIMIEKEEVGKYPLAKDYFPYDRLPKYYPDSILDDSVVEYLKNNKWDIKMIIEDDLVPEVYKSKMYDECKTKYDRAMGEYNEANESDWEKSEYGTALEQFGFTTYLTNTTYYGDWSCTTFNFDTKEELGKFCADAGMVGVFLLDEVKRYNPEFDLHETSPWTTTLIKGFKGRIDFVMAEIEGVFDEDSEFAGKPWSDTELRIKGYGNINFVTEQTGL